MKSSFIFQALAIFALFSFPCLAFSQNDVLNYRPYDQRGIHMFETPKANLEGVESSFKVRIGANFAQQFQALEHENTADSIATSATDPTNANRLVDLSTGFNLASANLNIDAQLTEGVRVNVVTYLSSRHHQEAYVKGGYIQFDELPFFNSPTIDNIMDNVTLKIGHYEINYGDAHFRRSDNGAALYNPFVENLILDAFNTEIGAEVVWQKNGLLFVGGVTNGEIKGDVVKIPDLKPEDVDDSSKKSPSWIGKLGYDKQVNDDLRVRLTGSVYHTGSLKANNLYGGDRAGSRYYLVLENTKASTSANFYSGRFSPRYSDKVFAGMAKVTDEIKIDFDLNIRVEE